MHMIVRERTAKKISIVDIYIERNGAIKVNAQSRLGGVLGCLKGERGAR